MLKSLFSGVSGLQSHQVAMDVESNNISNVNTVGFKYSRANFSDLLAQTNQIATAPQGDLGGKNAVQIGLGTQVNSTTRIFSQGSIQNTDKNTDIAIQGDGFFIVSGDKGQTLKYTRSGDFKFDADGNFVDNNGFIAQGWLRDEDTGKVDNTSPIRSIKIPPGLTTPASATQEISLKANLNSSNDIVSKSLIYSSAEIDSGEYKADDLGVLHNGNGQGFNLQPAVAIEGGGVEGGQGIEFGTNGKDGQHAQFRYTNDPRLLDIEDTDGNAVYYFTTTADMTKAMQHWLTANPANALPNPTAKVDIDENGKFRILNPDGEGAQGGTIDIRPIKDASTSENVYFTRSMQSLEGTLKVDGRRIAQSIYAATHASSIDVYDSLGSKHTIEMKFRKDAVTADGGTSWAYEIIVPEPGDLDALGTNVLKDNHIIFNNDGSIATNTRTRFSLTANNGSAPDQEVVLNFGSQNGFDGVTSFDAESTTSGISQDGFAGGDLVGIRIDQSGTLVGSFSNGRSFGLAQISLAKFANNEGLVSDGGNVFLQSANSGDPVIGAAASGGRGFVQASSLEASNVDLSRSLTQLIIIQRGFQANSKTITTSDQILNTLIQLKQ